MLNIDSSRWLQWTQDTDKPVRHDGGASVITYLRKGEKYCKAVEGVRSEKKNVRETTLQIPTSVKELGEVL